MTNKRFQRTIESFTCEFCGNDIEGGGYTNHCPHCLYSKHVDINPGDRASTCHGLMKPIAVLIQGQKYTLQHRCQKCGIIKNNKVAKADSFDKLLELAKQTNPPSYPRKYRDPKDPC